MAIISFEEFSKIANKPIINKKTTTKVLTTNEAKPILKKVNETAFIVGDTYKVKIVADVPKNLVDEYIEKVKEETGKNPLDNFSESEIAEQILLYTIKQNLLIDNLSSDFTVGTDNKISNQDSESDATALSDDMIDDESKVKEPVVDNNDGEIEFDDFNETDKVEEPKEVEPQPDGEINFDLEDKDTSNTEDFEFEEGENEKSDTTSKTVGDMKKKLGYKETIKEEEETIDTIYKKMGINTGFYENFSNQMFKK